MLYERCTRINIKIRLKSRNEKGIRNNGAALARVSITVKFVTFYKQLPLYRNKGMSQIKLLSS